MPALHISRLVVCNGRQDPSAIAQDDKQRSDLSSAIDYSHGWDVCRKCKEQFPVRMTDSSGQDDNLFYVWSLIRIAVK